MCVCGVGVGVEEREQKRNVMVRVCCEKEHQQKGHITTQRVTDL
jgi:hypothetical protein